MKKVIMLPLLAVCFTLIGCNRPTQKPQPAEDDGTVYVCEGSWAGCYHLFGNCESLQSCGGTIRQITLEEAQEEGLIPCPFCAKKKK